MDLLVLKTEQVIDFKYYESKNTHKIPITKGTFGPFKEPGPITFGICHRYGHKQKQTYLLLAHQKQTGASGSDLHPVDRGQQSAP
jgi:hypothetical protein